jgi:hypothetical protein
MGKNAVPGLMAAVDFANPFNKINKIRQSCVRI